MIVVFGSLNVDLVMPVASLPQPGETVLCPDYALKPGGKGANQAVAAARAGAPVAMIGSVGRDGFGTTLIETLQAAGVDTAGVARVDRPTGCAAIGVDSRGENAIMVASGANRATVAAQTPDSRLTAGTLVLMQMEVPPEQNWELARRARALGARTILNAAPAGPVPREVLADLDVLVVNRGEGETVAAGLGLKTASPAGIVRGLAACGLTAVMTLGAEGALAATAEGLWQVPPLPVTPVDTTGAGDAFCGVLAAALDAGLALPEALRRASVGAALACLALGAQESLPFAAAIAAQLNELPPPLCLD